ncbi:MAG: spirocyclase AveC family protein [Panacagrimonas sp.]
MATTHPAGSSALPARSSEQALPLATLLWAGAGVLMCLFSAAIFGQWIVSDQFATVPISEAAAMPDDRIAILHGLEVLSLLVAVSALLGYLVLPRLRRGEWTTEGLLLVGALVTYVLDTMVNYQGYYMAWNQHALNWGTWAAFFPGHTGPTRYAEALLWGPPMYLYFGVALATLQLFVLRLLRGAPLALAFVAAFAAAFLFDLVAEVSIIHVTQAYAWANTLGALTLWVGEFHQFPLYEPFLVAIYATLYTLLIRSRDARGETFIERGAHALPDAPRLLLRFLAATGFASLCTLVYFSGFALISTQADTAVALPAYMGYLDAQP